jgi:membrane fusion protein (multidrug efflux system)
MTVTTPAMSIVPRRIPPIVALTGSLLVLAVIAVSGCDSANGKAEDKDATARQTVPVEVTTPRRAEMTAVYSGTAPVEAERKAFVMPKVGGEIRAVFVDEGAQVHTGQLLARLDGDRLRLELAQAEAQMRKLERDYNRNVELQKRGLVSALAFENLKYELDSARATWELARLQLSWTDIRSPIAGTVTTRTNVVKVGNTVTPVGGVIESSDSALFVVEDLDSLVVRVNVPERELSRLSKGQSAELSLDALPGRKIAGRIALVSPYVDASAGTIPVRIELQDPDHALRPGMFARVDIVYERKPDALQIPRAALLDSEGPARVYIVQDGQAAERAIDIGMSNGGWIEVVAGLTDDDQVVVIGQNAVKDGAAVRIVNAGENPAPKAATAG